MTGNAGMHQLISVINRLQDSFAVLELPLQLDLPQIAVVGSQSAGKSSVLENFVGRDFLPRGSGIVTRRPLILQLINDNLEYGEFLHLRGKRFSNFDEIRMEIEAETDRATGGTKNISNIPINLRIHSPHVLNLTLVDLPGLTKVAIKDQPKDIEIQIRNMILEFITQDNCLILAVTPANTDLANSDALKIAKEVDPQGVRTIGVITKLDLMDHGTDAREILENKLLPLRRGYIGVVNRSQRDIDGKKDILAAVESEKIFFLGHSAYRHMVDRMGTHFLQKTLNQQLVNHIREALPELRNRLQTQLLSIDSLVKEYKTVRPSDPAHKAKNLMQMIQQFDNTFCQSIEGYAAGVDTEHLSGGAEINRIFHERFPYDLIQVQCDERSLRREIAVAIRNIHGVRPGLFTPDMAFETVVRKRITSLSTPTVKCVDLVVVKLSEVIHKCSEHLLRYPKLCEEIEQHTLLRLREYDSNVKAELKTMLDYQLTYMNTNHEDFIGFDNASKKTNDATSVKLGNQVICKGWLRILSSNLIGRNGYSWFVLKADSLTWYKDDEEREKKYVLILDGLRQKATDASFMRKPAITLFYLDPKMNVYRDHKTLDLAADNQEGMESWKAALLRAGVYPVKDEPTEIVQEEDSIPPDGGASSDPLLERQVEVINNLVDSYMKIVTKTHRDMVPKVIMHSLINKVKYFLRTELLPVIYTLDMDRLMEESPEEIERREKLLNMYDALTEGLRIISEVNVNTISTPLPPPVNEDWLQPDQPKISVASPNPSNAGRKLSTRTLDPSPSQNGTLGRSNSPLPHKLPARVAPTRPAPTVTIPPKTGNVSNVVAAFQAPINSTSGVPLIPERLTNGNGGFYQRSLNKNNRSFTANQGMNHLSQSMSDLANINWGTQSNVETSKVNANSTILFDVWEPNNDSALNGATAAVLRPSTSASMYEPNSVFHSFATGQYLKANSKDRASEFLV